MRKNHRDVHTASDNSFERCAAANFRVSEGGTGVPHGGFAAEGSHGGAAPRRGSRETNGRCNAPRRTRALRNAQFAPVSFAALAPNDDSGKWRFSSARYETFSLCLPAPPNRSRSFLFPPRRIENDVYVTNATNNSLIAATDG